MKETEIQATSLQEIGRNEPELPQGRIQVLEVPELSPKRPERPWAHEDAMRGWLAIGFAAIFGLTVAWGCYSATGAHWTNAKELLQLLLPAETALLGSAVGFYFGAKK